MKKYLCFVVALLFPLSGFAGHHEATENQIIFAINADIVDGKAESFRSLLEDMVPAVKASEPNTMRYQYFINSDDTKLTLIEVYPDNEAALFHMTAFGSSPFADEFLASITITSFVVAGNASAALMEAVEPFTTDNRPFTQGFIR
jgi:quinol monooxygenase YgiN